MSQAKIPPKPSKDVIYVDVDDEITGIIDKVENSTHKVVALVLPKRAASLQSIVNMKLLARSSDSSGKNVVLITSEAALLPLAGAAGLHVAKNLQTKPEIPEGPAISTAPASSAKAAPATDETAEEDLPSKIDYQRSIGALAARHDADRPETIDLEDEDEAAPVSTAAAKPPKDKKNKVPNFDRFRMLLGLGGLGLVALIILLILAIFVLPKATITLTTAAEPVSAEFNLTASSSATSLDEADGTIPAKLQTTDQTSSQSIQATGQQNNGQKATGDATMTTCVSSPGQLSDVPAGTGVSTNGLTYITQQDASFSFVGACNNGANFKFQSNSVDITAQQAGAKFNTSIDGATVAGYSGVSASGSAAGGTDNIITVLSQNDVEAAKQKINSGNDSDFAKKFEKKLTDQGEYVLSSTLKAGEPSINASPAVGQPASTANVTIKTTYTVLTVKKADLIKVITDKLQNQINKSKQKLSDNLLDDANITVQSQSSPSSATLAISENTTAVPIINVASVKKQVEGHKAGDIRAALGAWPGVKRVDVDMSPFWVSKVPKKDSKVTVVFKRDKSASSNASQQP